MEVWVTGLGCVSAAGAGVRETWRALVEGPPVRPEPPARLLALAASLGLEALSGPAFAVGDEVFAGGFRHSARDTLTLALTAAGEALAQAELGRAELAGGRTAVVIGSTAGAAPHFLEDYAALKRGLKAEGRGFGDFFACNPAAALAAAWGLSGPVLTVGDACCSGADAVGLALDLISGGLADRALAGGADALTLAPYIGFSRLMIYADAPCRPFDRDRRGLNLGEGAGLLVLEAAGAASKRGARPLAVLAGYGAASDAYHLTAPHPEAAGLKRAIGLALEDAGLKAADLAFVNAHGTATPDNDRAEALAIAAELPQTPLWAVKGSTGHTLGAAGALEAVLTVTALRENRLPPSHGFVNEDRGLGLRPSAPLASLRGEAAMSLSLGFGGGNAALVFRRA
jgi:3-oxoacyl-[acyl-carrier-protein] synthase-1/3-oxoacyl-[acyl-carrier-protein] synthase II